MKLAQMRIALKLAVAAALVGPFSASAAPSGYDDPLPRVEDKLCPGISGMREDGALQLIDRIRANAERVGIAMADPDTCTPNMLVFFVEDANDTLNSLMKRQPRLFDSLSVNEQARLKADPRPVRAWNRIVTRSRDGMPIYDADNLEEIPQTTMWGAHSKIYVPVRREVASTVVLFESKAIVGKNLNQLADYASMRAFASDFTAFPQDKASILKLFDSESAPTEMTQSDRTFLTVLYEGIPNLPGRFKRSSIENALAAE
jgi:hypothetical protein